MRIAHQDRCVNFAHHLGVASSATSATTAENRPISPQLMAANALLAARRKVAVPRRAVVAPRANPQSLPAPSLPLLTPSVREGTKSLSLREGLEDDSWLTPLVDGLHSAENTHLPPTTKPTTIKVYPSLLTAMLRQEMTTIGRIWLLCRALDRAGQGWLHVEQLRTELTDKASDWHIVGWRRLRQLLQQGRGTLWERDKFGRIWLYGTARVANNLNVLRLQGNAVNLPIGNLLNSIQDTKAAFYATFHAGRKTANPISRATLRELTGSSETTQRTYEASSNITATANYCISGIRHTPENVRAEAYKRPVVFAVTDRKTGQQQIAWPLPNNYQTTLQTACRGRQRKINRQLKLSSDLVIQGRGGTEGDFGRIFCANGQQALQCSQQQEQYWQDTSGHWCCNHQ